MNDSRRPRTSPRTPLLWWVAALVAHRALVMVFGFDGVFFWEEAYRLLMGEAIRSGWNIPIHDLQADPYAGGSLVFSALAAAVTSATGPSLLAVKSVALAWSALGLWLWLLVADRIGGRTVAHALGLLWVASPPILVVFNVLALGSHSDTITLSGLQFLLLYRYLDRPGSGRLLAWMAAAGVGVWFSYASAITLAASAAYALALGALPLRLWPVAALGFLAGFSPWILRTAIAGGAFDVLARTFAGEATSRGYLATLYDLTTHGVPVALYFRDTSLGAGVRVPRALVSYPYLAVYAAAWIAVVARITTRLARSANGGGSHGLAAVRRVAAAAPEIPIVAVFPLFLLVIAASNQEFNDYGVVPFITFRILVPALPSLMFTVALAATRAGGALRFGVLAACVLAGFVGTLGLLAAGSSTLAGREQRARTIGAEAMGHLIVFKHGTDAAVARERIEALPAELHAAAWRGVGASYAYLYANRRSEEPAAGLTEALRSVEEAKRPIAIDGARLAIDEGPDQVAPVAPSPRRDELRAAIEAAAR